MHYLKTRQLRRLLQLLCIVWLGLAANAHAENCQIQLSQTTLDYGNFTRGAMQERQGSASQLSLGDRQLSLNVWCQQPANMAVVIRGPSMQDNFKFGERGQFAMRFSAAMLDGKPVSLGVASAKGQPVTESGASVIVLPDTTVMPFSAGRRIKGKTFSLQVHIDPKMAEAATRVHEQTSWQGAVNFAVIER